MAQHCIKGKRIRRVCIPKEYDIDKIQIESAIYGNATYIIPKENWEILSQKTKKELFDENKVIGKIDHTDKWKQNVSDKFRMLEVVLSK